jgi:AbrB family looped-hinge helix DNA binding protein
MMIVETSTVGAQGTVTIPAALRARFGLEEGTLVIAEERQDGVLIRPTVREGEAYSPAQQAQFLLSNAVDAVDYTRAREAVQQLGMDPDSIPHRTPDET